MREPPPDEPMPGQPDEPIPGLPDPVPPPEPEQPQVVPTAPVDPQPGSETAPDSDDYEAGGP
jgi:hypothetical protein